MPKHRYAFRPSDARWLNLRLATEGDAFDTDADELAADLTRALGEAVRVVETDGDDPRTGQLVPLPVPPPPPPTPARLEADALAAFLAGNPDPAAWTNAQLREALIRLLRNELRRHGLP